MSSGGNGGRGSRAISHSSRPRPKRGRFDAKPSAQHSAVSLQGSAQARNRLAGESRTREKAGKTASGSLSFGGERNFAKRHQKSSGRLLNRETRKLSQPAAQFRDASTHQRLRYSHRAGTAWSQGCEHDDDLYARAQQTWHWCEEPARLNGDQTSSH